MYIVSLLKSPTFVYVRTCGGYDGETVRALPAEATARLEETEARHRNRPEPAVQPTAEYFQGGQLLR